MKLMPKIKVEFLPFYESIKSLPKEEAKEFGLIMSNGKVSEYRKAFIEGLGASIKEKTWDRKKFRHRCCGSRVSWRHRRKCKEICRNAPDDLSDLKDIDEVFNKNNLD